MTNDNKPPMFGPSAVFDPATYEPRSGKSFWMAETDTSSLTDKGAEAETLIGNCTTSLSFKFDLDPKDNGHTVMFGTTREGMSFSPVFTRDVLLALGSLKAKAQSTGITLRDLSVQMGMQSTLQGNKRLLDALERLIAQQAVPGLDFSRTDGIVRIASDA